MLKEELFELDMSDFNLDWNIEEKEELNEIERKDLSETIKEQFELIIDCDNEEGLEQLYNELTERGYKCKISTL